MKSPHLIALVVIGIIDCVSATTAHATTALSLRYWPPAHVVGITTNAVELCYLGATNSPRTIYMYQIRNITSDENWFVAKDQLVDGFRLISVERDGSAICLQGPRREKTVLPIGRSVSVAHYTVLLKLVGVDTPPIVCEEGKTIRMNGAACLVLSVLPESEKGLGRKCVILREWSTEEEHLYGPE